jgi:hypothetical protein
MPTLQRSNCSRGADRLPAQGLVVVAIRENLFLTDAARLIRRGESDSVRIAAETELHAISKIGIMQTGDRTAGIIMQID